MSYCLRHSAAEICLQYLKAMASDYEENMLNVLDLYYLVQCLSLKSLNLSYGTLSKRTVNYA